MRASRKKMINVTCSQDVRKRVDEFLSSEYQAWKESKEPRRYSNGIFTCGNETNNTLIMEYIHYIYNEYQIADPLLDNKHDGLRETSLRSSQKSHRSQKIEITSYNQQKPDSIQVKIVDPELDEFQPQEFSQKDFEEEKNQEMITPFKKIEKGFRETEPKRGLYDSRETTTHHREFSEKQDTLEKSRYSLGLSLEKKYGESKTPKQGLDNPEKGFFQFSNKIKNLKQEREGPIPEVYRYCLACENAVLDRNVEQHEINCEEFQKLYEMDLQEILNHITTKINSLRLKLRSKVGNLTEKDPANMRQVCENMNLECDDILSSGQMTQRFIHSYDEAIKIGKKWSEASEETNKLRWFIKVREEIKKHFDV